MTSTTGAEFPRFLTLADVADILQVDLDVVRDLVTTNELAAIRIGVDGAFRVEQRELEHFIADKYEARRRETMLEQAEFTDLPEITGSGSWRDRT
ncbi:helix-turn-helix domain-containing protein [Gulosibacter faecalis]|jgi:hypothetical protein|uniref:Helix-turn-helix domain-containing protein n=1 Tax=Gulosibacter faecalis TaxID=272240 RepID=A0ABW5UZK0_9MICO|nr:helix-turn-helix domain-containing protein [Gulosibacter faecalis]